MRLSRTTSSRRAVVCPTSLTRVLATWAVITLVLATPAAAIDYRTYLDLDDNMATGCDVGTVDGAFNGVEEILLTTTTGLQVTAVSRQVCVDPVTDTFGASIPVSDFATPWAVGSGTGLFGADVVETYYPFAAPMTSGSVRFAVEADDGMANVDAVLGLSVTASQFVPAIPTLSEVSLLLLVSLLLAAAAWQLRRRRQALRATAGGLAVLLMLASGGTALAAGIIVLDGMVGDWLGTSDAQLNDGTAGGVGNSDILSMFAAFHPDGTFLFLRFDVDSSALPPVANDDAFTVNEDSGATVLDVRANDTDPDGGAITITGITQPANGTVVNNGGADVSYTPNANYCNTPIPPGTADTFTYTLNGGDVGTVSVTVTCIDDPTVAVADTATVTEDDPATVISVLANDNEVDGDPFSVTAVTQPANGTVVNNTTDVSYTPDPNYCNTPIPPGTVDTFTYTITGGSMATVGVTVTCADDPADAVDDPSTVTEDDPATTIDVLANDSDAESDPFVITGVTQPANGTVVITNAGADLTYVPDANYCNTPIPPGTVDTFTYTVTGGDTATVSVTVTCADDPAVAVDDPSTVTEDDPATTIDVLANDSDAESDPFVITGVTQPANGTVVITNAGADLTYAPDANYCNTPIPPGTVDTFTYTITGGDTATVSVTVTCVVDPPDAVNDTTYETIGNTELVVAGATPTSLARLTNATSLLANDTDPEMSGIQVSAVGADITAPFTGPTTLGGLVTVNANGSFVYLPPRGVLNMADSFMYTITSGVGGMDTATATINIRNARAWYVHNDPAGEPLNPVDGAAFGRSDDPFDTLAAAEAAHGAGDLICLFEGSGTNTGMNAGITLSANNVRLHGEHHGCDFNLALNGNAAPAVVLPATATRHAHIGHTAGNSIRVDATAGSVTGIEIRGVEVASIGGNALDVTTAGANNVEVTFENSIVGGASLEGVDINHASSGTATVRITNVTPFSSTGNAIDARETGTGNLELRLMGNLGLRSTGGNAIHVDGSGGAGTTFITAFSGNSVHQDTAGTGVFVDTAVFDDVIGAPLGAVNAGNFAVGVAADGVGGAGMVLDTVTGDLRFSDLDIEAATSGLVVIGTGEFTGAAGFNLVSTSGTLTALGPVVDIDPATANLQFDSITATGGTNSVSLRDVAGTFDANAGSLTGSTGTAFEIVGNPATSSLTVNYSGTLGNAAGRVIDVDGLPLGNLTFDGASLTDSGTGVGVNNMGATLTVSATSNTFTGTAGLTVTGNTDGTVNFDDATIQTTGTPISITDAADQIAGTFDFDNVDVTHGANGVLGLDVQGLNGGSVNFDAFSSFTATDGTGFNIASNPNANVTFAAGSTVDLGTGANRISDGTAFNMSGNGAATVINIPDLDVFTSAQTAVNASGSGTLNLDALSINTASNGRALDLDGILSLVDVDSVVCSHNSNCVDLTSLAATSNTTFAGVGLTCTGGTCFNASSARTVEVTGAGNTIAATNAVGLNFTSTTIGVNDATFESISSSGAATGITLNGTGSTGTFTVTGDGSMTAGVFDRDGTGGAITSTIGASLTNANDVTLRKINFTNNSDHAVTSSGGSDHVLSAVTIQNPTNHGWEATDLTGVNRIDHDSLVTAFNGLSQDGVRLENTNTNFTSFTVDNSTFSASSSGNDGFFHRALGTTTGAVVVSDSTFTGLDADGVQVTNDGSGTTTTTITGCTFQTADNTGGDGNNGIALNIGGSGVHNFTVGGAGAGDGNLLDDLTRLGDNSGMINITAAGAASGGSQLIGLVQGNTIQNTTGRRGVSVVLEASNGAHGGHTITIDDNDINAIARQGISISVTTVGANNSTGNLITITDNRIGTVTPVGTNPSSSANAEGIDIRTAATTSGNIGVDFVITGNQVVTNNTDETVQIDAANTSGTTTMNLEVLGNTITNSNAGGDTFEVRNITASSTVCLDLNSGNVMADRNNANRGYGLQRLAGTFGIDSIGGGGPFVNGTVNTFVDARNDGGASAASGDGFTNCTVP